MIKAIHFGRIMAITQTDIDNLNAAIASGTRSVTIGGQTITYGTVDALIRARNDLQKLLNAEAGARTRSRQTYAYHAGRSY
jgi:microcompartment protein CcmL/EutN